MNRAIVLTAALVACAPKYPGGPIAAEEAAKPVRLVTLPDNTGPNLYLQAIIGAGSAYDPVGKEGIAHLTAQSLVDAGAGERSAQEVRDALYPTGNGLQVVVDREWVSLRLRCHADHAALCVEIFADTLTRPRFDAVDVVRTREQSEYNITDGLLSDEEALGQEVLDALIFDGHPYGHPIEGRAGVLPTLDDDAARAFYQAHYVREATLAGIGGNYSEEARKQLEERLAVLPAQRAPELVLQQPVAVEGRSLQIVSTHTDVTGIHFAHPLPVARDHEDWPALYVAMIALGAHRQSFGRLFRILRTTRGLNYGDYAYIEPYVQRGWEPLPEQGVIRRQPYFYTWIRPTSIDNGPFALRLAIAEVERMVADGLTEDELDDIREHLRGYTPLLAQDPGRRLAYVLDAEATGTPNPLEAIPAALETLTLAEVNAAVARHLHPADLRIVAVSGDAEGLRDRLLEEKETPIVYRDVTPDEVQAARDAEVAAWPLGLTEETVWITEAEGIFR